MTQAELAKRLGVAQQTVAAWESGRAMPAADKLVALADVLGVTTDALLGRPVPKVSSANLDLELLKNTDPAEYEALMLLVHNAANRHRRRD